MGIQKFIAHRGNTAGPNMSLENEPSYILNALNLGFDCEVDVWLVNKELFLGHDEPIYKTSIEFLTEHQNSLWVHCKNFESLEYLNKIGKINYFWHQEDNFTLTSKGYIWTYPDNNIGGNSVIVDNKNKVSDYECYGVCSDYIGNYR